MSPTNRKLSHRVDGRLAAYATLAGVALAAPAFAPSAEATIVYSGTVNLNIQSTTNGLYLNVVLYPAVGSINEPGNTGGSTVPGWDVNPWSSSGLSFFLATGGGYVQRTGGGATANLPLGTMIDGTSLYGGSDASTTGAQPFVLSSTNYVGFKFLGQDALTHYGWMQISVGTTLGGQPRTLVSFAYEDVAGVGILAGAVPEPSTFALLGVMAAGALGVREWRKRKAA